MELVKKIFKKIKLRTLIILILLLIANSYAWFIYATKVNMGFNAHVSSWNVNFEIGDSESSTNVIVDVERMYPGMDTFSQTIVAKNNGETRAKLSYRIKSITMLGETSEVSESLTSEELANRLANDYPFHLTIGVDNHELEAGQGQGTFTITLEWPFESGDDAKDTEWGEKAYEFYATNPGVSSIHLDLEIIAQQSA